MNVPPWIASYIRQRRLEDIPITNICAEVARRLPCTDAMSRRFVWAVLREQDSITPARMLLSSGKIPEPHLDAGQNFVNSGGRRVYVLASSLFPRYFIFADFATNEECKKVIEGCELVEVEILDKSELGSHAVQRKNAEVQPSSVGASMLSVLTDRLSELVQWPASRIEPFQVFRSMPTDVHSYHVDHFSTEAIQAQPDILKAGGQRLGTFILYLKAPIAGGRTVFPTIGLEVALRPGMAIYFLYDDERHRNWLLHSGAEVKFGEKVVAVTAVRESALF